MNKQVVTDQAVLDEIYGKPARSSVIKEIDFIHPLYRPFIEKAPFVTLATSGVDGLDVSPRGDEPGFIQVKDEKTLLLPDRRGNNRIDSLRNIIHDNRVALLFLIPGISETLRIHGRAEIEITPSLLEEFAVNHTLPRSVLRIHVESVFFQCGRAVLRSQLWEDHHRINRASLPGTGEILAVLSQGEVDGAEYDRILPQRLRDTLY